MPKKILEKEEVDKIPFTYFPEYCASFLLIKDHNDKEEPTKFLIRMEEKKFRGIVLEISRVQIGKDKERTLKFEYDMIYNPYDKSVSFNRIESFLNKTVTKVVENIIKINLQQEKEKNERRDIDFKIITL